MAKVISSGGNVRDPNRKKKMGLDFRGKSQSSRSLSYWDKIPSKGVATAAPCSVRSHPVAGVLVSCPHVRQLCHLALLACFVQRRPCPGELPWLVILSEGVASKKQTPSPPGHRSPSGEIICLRSPVQLAKRHFCSEAVRS